MELFLSELPYKTRKKGQYQTSDYQMVERDFAFVVSKDESVGNILRLVENIDKKLIKKVDLFDLYDGDQVEEGYKSVAFSVKIQADNRTLTEVELSTLSESIITKILSSVKGASLR
jgi:phenylalanyl-tRNA synthetase beta chain